jgi:hypothetical protein
MLKIFGDELTTYLRDTEKGKGKLGRAFGKSDERRFRILNHGKV